MKDQRSWVESCAAIISSYFSLAGPGELECLDKAPELGEPPTPRAATELLSSLPPLGTLFLPTPNCFTAVFSHQTSLLLERETYCYQIPSPCGGSNSFPSPVKYAGFPTLPRATFSIPIQITLFLKR